MKIGLIFLVFAFSTAAYAEVKASEEVKVVDLLCEGKGKGIGQTELQIAAIVQRAFPSGKTYISVSFNGYQHSVAYNELASLDASYQNGTLMINGYDSKNAQIKILRPKISYERTSYILTVTGTPIEVDCTEYRPTGTR